MADALSAKEAARELGTDARTFRKFMRATTPRETQPGQGNRYNIDPDQMPKLKSKFTEWSKPKVKTEKPPVAQIAEDAIDGDFELFDDEVVDADALEQVFVGEEDEDIDLDDDDTPDFSASSDDEEPSDEELLEIEADGEIDLEEL